MRDLEQAFQALARHSSALADASSSSKSQSPAAVNEAVSKAAAADAAYRKARQECFVAQATTLLHNQMMAAEPFELVASDVTREKVQAEMAQHARDEQGLAAAVSTATAEVDASRKTNGVLLEQTQALMAQAAERRAADPLVGVTNDAVRAAAQGDDACREMLAAQEQRRVELETRAAALLEKAQAIEGQAAQAPAALAELQRQVDELRLQNAAAVEERATAAASAAAMRTAAQTKLAAEQARVEQSSAMLAAFAGVDGVRCLPAVPGASTRTWAVKLGAAVLKMTIDDVTGAPAAADSRPPSWPIVGAVLEPHSVPIDDILTDVAPLAVLGQGTKKAATSTDRLARMVPALIARVRVRVLTTASQRAEIKQVGEKFVVNASDPTKLIVTLGSCILRVAVPEGYPLSGELPTVLDCHAFGGRNQQDADELMKEIALATQRCNEHNTKTAGGAAAGREESALRLTSVTLAGLVDWCATWLERKPMPKTTWGTPSKILARSNSNTSSSSSSSAMDMDTSA